MNSVYKIIIFIALTMTIIPATVFSQRGLFITGGIEYGNSESDKIDYYKFQQRGSKLAINWQIEPDSNSFDSYINPEITFHYHFLEHFGISLSFKLMEKIISVHDQYFMSANHIPGSPPFEGFWGNSEAEAGNFLFSRLYFNPSISGYYLLLPPDKKCRPFISLGIGFNKYMSNNREVVCDYYHISSEEDLLLKAHYKNEFLSHNIEVGIFFSHGTKNNPNTFRLKMATRGIVGSISFRYSFIGNFLHADYQNSKNGSIQYRDQLTVNGEYFGLVLKAGLGIFGKAMDKAYKKQYDNSLAFNSDSKKPNDDIINPGKINSRRLVIKNTITLNNNDVKIYVSDNAKYDGDVVSLNLNGEWILLEETLTLEKILLHAKLKEGPNYLAAYSISEGSEKPCTVAIIIDDGISQQILILNSDKKNCETIRINVLH